MVVFGCGALYLKGHLPALDRLAGWSERVSGLPAWATIPFAVAWASLTSALFGFYWDVSWHIDRGRDPGPFSNPAHWFIIWGLVGIAVAGLASIALVSEDDAPRTVIRFREGWRAPLGGALVLLCGTIALAGFPLDDIWHALFGQDVTLWGPTHIQMIGGASLATLALWMLAEEGRRHRRRVSLPWVSEHRTSWPAERSSSVSRPCRASSISASRSSASSTTPCC